MKSTCCRKTLALEDELVLRLCKINESNQVYYHKTLSTPLPYSQPIQGLPAIVISLTILPHDFKYTPPPFPT
ncbi:hypothetical protein RRG08_034067 [Elysia crispata]|uniref:Uncharacterized protein n=1 Tax=Elysia crispata TaxID=231223 RepID=A0AAE0YLM7_9GAST|nr:hypothetical protein RRG08_034067 [Elysia crispata]